MFVGLTSGRLVIVYLVNSIGFRIAWKTNLWACLRGSFYIDLVEWKDSPMARDPGLSKKEKGVSQHLPLLSDSGPNVISDLML